jgi:hypothetical protein
MTEPTPPPPPDVRRVFLAGAKPLPGEIREYTDPQVAIDSWQRMLDRAKKGGDYGPDE